MIAKVEALRTLGAGENDWAGVSAALEVIQQVVKQYAVKTRMNKLETALASLKSQLTPEAPVEDKPPGKKRGRKPKPREAVQAELS